MLIRHVILFCALFLAAATHAATESDISLGDSPTAAELAAAMLRAQKNPDLPFQLQVNCTDQKGIRSFNLFPSGVTIWKGQSQLSLPSATRTSLLTMMLDRGFPEFEAKYGGRVRAEKEAAAPRISCRIALKIEKLQKASVQMAGGEQSAALTGLAASLLDQVEPFVADGITANSLQDALDKLLNGQLAPEALSLRFVELPVRDYIRQGSIVRLRGGRLSRQAYTPGTAIGETSWQALEQESYRNLLTALRTADPGSLPGNLWSEDQLELEVQVLSQKKVVLARPFSRLDRKAQEPAQQRFDTLLKVLLKLGQ